MGWEGFELELEGIQISTIKTMTTLIHPLLQDPQTSCFVHLPRVSIFLSVKFSFSEFMFGVFFVLRKKMKS